ncbi:MAG: hypothetical protein CLLPBCKN_004091 [Chroococcidiopsis cubana SAG 39.79]|nr:hypothetical protein [Chroococcidiopsis cubana SAG 39.79]
MIISEIRVGEIINEENEAESRPPYFDKRR